MSEETQKCDCPEEKIAHGNLGTVKDGEMLARFIPLDDEKFVDDSHIKKGALPVEHFLREGDGWSLLRKMHVTDMAEELKNFAEGKRGEDYGYALVKATDVRQILDEEQRRAVCVIDKPTSKNPAHAIAQKARFYKIQKARRIRNNLLQKFGEVKSIMEKK